ncbi:MAG TPA: hypothetical protein VD866_12785, partial [Urbifossiella sp.]|nr:hypothetical protein [Urbifossiella sp.]
MPPPNLPVVDPNSPLGRRLAAQQQAPPADLDLTSPAGQALLRRQHDDAMSTPGGGAPVDLRGPGRGEPGGPPRPSGPTPNLTPGSASPDDVLRMLGGASVG